MSLSDYVDEYGDPIEIPEEMEFDWGAHPEDHVKPSDIERGVTDRTIVVNLDTNMRELSKGEGKNVWKIPEETIQKAIFQRIVRLDPETREKMMEGNLSKAVILKAKVNWVRNGGPVDMVAKIPQVRGKTFTGKSKEGAALFLPSRTVAPLPQDKQIYVPEDPISQQALESRVPVELTFDETSHFEHPKNRYIEDPRQHKMIVSNTGLLGTILHDNKRVFDYQPKHAKGVDEVYNLPKPFVEAVVAQFRDDIKYTNLRDFSVTFERADGKPFNSAANVAGRYGGHNANGQKALESIDMDNHFNVGFEVELTYCLVD